MFHHDIGHRLGAHSHPINCMMIIFMVKYVLRVHLSTIHRSGVGKRDRRKKSETRPGAVYYSQDSSSRYSRVSSKFMCRVLHSMYAHGIGRKVGADDGCRSSSLMCLTYVHCHWAPVRRTRFLGGIHCRVSLK